MENKKQEVGLVLIPIKKLFKKQYFMLLLIINNAAEEMGFIHSTDEFDKIMTNLGEIYSIKNVTVVKDKYEGYAVYEK